MPTSSAQVFAAHVHTKSWAAMFTASACAVGVSARTRTGRPCCSTGRNSAVWYMMLNVLGFAGDIHKVWQSKSLPKTSFIPPALAQMLDYRVKEPRCQSSTGARALPRSPSEEAGSEEAEGWEASCRKGAIEKRRARTADGRPSIKCDPLVGAVVVATTNLEVCVASWGVIQFVGLKHQASVID